jgi:hypothetical protein
MAYRIPEADSASDPSTPQALSADPLQAEHDQLQALCQRLEAAAAALLRLRDKLQAQASEKQETHQERGNGGAGAGGPEGEEDRR